MSICVEVSTERHSGEEGGHRQQHLGWVLQGRQERCLVIFCCIPEPFQCLRAGTCHVTGWERWSIARPIAQRYQQTT
jgi:hypothetical protein